MSGPKKIEVNIEGNEVHPDNGITITEASEKYEVSRQTIYNMIEDGRIDTVVRHGRTICLV